MGELGVAAAIVLGYVAVLVAVAAWAERHRRRVASSPLVYALSIGVYATAWTYYGSVGFAARNGLLFLAVYLGPTLCAVLWWWILRKLVRIKSEHRVTGLPDLLALRYEKSQTVSIVATVLLVVGLLPYLALQLKTLIATLGIVAGGGALAYPESGSRVGPPLVAILLLFTVIFGLRRVRPTERHPGMMAALAVECVVKLVAFLAVGAWLTYGVFDGFGDVFRRAATVAAVPELLGGEGVVTWLLHLLLSGFAVILLPRQFHVAVVESSDERHIRTAMWVFPAYLFAINLFVLPLALGGLLLGHPVAEADTFVLALPLAAGETALSWFAFLGGFSAGTGMVLVETTALATMISNHLVLPAAEAWGSPAGVRRRLRETRWLAAALVLGGAFAYERLFGAQFALASIGFISFAAVLQLAPAVVGGLYWRGASRVGALAGISVGAAVWAYTLVVPVLVRSGWLPASLLVEGPFGVEPLAPEGLFDVHLDSVSHAVLWTLVLNGGAFVLGSLLFPPEREEEERTARLVRLLVVAPPREREETPAVAVADAGEKRRRAVALFAAYHGEEAATKLADECLARVGARAERSLSALQLAQLQSEVEICLAAAIGSAAAHAAVRRDPLVDPEESRTISQAYAEILAELNVSPADLQRRIDYHRERERLLAREAETQRFLAGVGGLLGASLDEESTARTAVRLPVPYLAEAALLSLAAHGRQPSRAFFAHVDPALEAAGAAAADEAAAELERARAVVRAVRTSMPVVHDASDDGSWPSALAAVLPRGREVTVPLLAGERTLGTLTLFPGEGGVLHPPDELGLAQELARRLAIAIENARAFGRAEEAVRVRDEFLAVASHELKTPLTPLRLRIQTLERIVARGELGVVPPEKLAQLFGGAEEQVLRVAALVDDLLDVTRITAGRLTLRPEPMDLAGSLGAVVERYAGQLAQAGCAVTLETPESLPGTWDRARVEQVVGNLLVNAAKYAPGSRVEVRAEGQGERARIVVRDEGPGIPAEDRERIFLPFERVAREGQDAPGLGLGLFIVRQIVDAHGGSITASSEPGRGTTFVVELPLRAEEVAAAK